MTVQITPTFVFPDRSLGSTIVNAQLDAFYSAFVIAAPQMNSMATEMNSNAVIAAAAAVTATAQAGYAIAAVNAPAWVSGTTYTIGQCAWSPANGITYRRKVAGAGTTDPSLDSANWNPAITVNTLKVSARAANTNLTGNDLATYVDATTGTWNQTLTAAATLGNGWHCYIGNSGLGFITIDPNGAELITRNGVDLTTWILWPNEVGLLVCDGVGFTYLTIQKGRITTTISSAVASIAWSTGFAYRRDLSITIDGLNTSATAQLEIKLNATVISNFNGLVCSYGGSYISGSAATGTTNLTSPFSTNSSVAGLCSVITLTARPAATSISHSTKFYDSTPQYVFIDGKGVWTTITEATITGIGIYASTGNITSGTITIQEL